MSEPEPISPKQFRDYPELREWLGHDYGSMWDYLNFRGNYELAAVFAKLFWPDFVEVDGSVYLADKFHANGDYRWEDTGWTRTQIESVVNHCHFEHTGFQQGAAVP